MEATSATTEATPAALAAELAAFWRELMRGSTKPMFALLAELEINMTQLKLLHVLVDRDSEASVKELAEDLSMSLANASRTIDGLLQRGWLERREDQHDRRIKRVGATPLAREVLERIDTARLQGLETWAERLSPDQRRTLLDALSPLPKERRA